MSGIIDILKKADDDIRSIMLHKDNRYLRNLLEAAYFEEKKLQLPDGDPPYKPNAMEEGQVEPGIMWQFAKKLDIFQKKYDKPVNIKIETSFIQVLESVSKDEAKIILAVKDQKLNRIFKSLTLPALKKIGYFQ